MKILFVIEYYLPYVKGGSEWSTYYLAKQLAENGHDVTVLTPNLGSKSAEINEKVKILRYPFYIKIKKTNKLPGHFALTNPVWLLWSFFWIFIFIKKIDPDIIHIHGKYSIPPTILANVFSRKPLLATIRDYVIVCNYAFCLFNSTRACSLTKYIKEDFTYYYYNYVLPKNLYNFLANLVFALWGRLSRNYLRYFAKKIPLVALSNVQKKILEINGFKNVSTIVNSVELPKKIPRYEEKENIITYAGRLTIGKGVGVLNNILDDVLNKFPNFKFYFIGDGNLRKEIAGHRESRVKLLSSLKHHDLLKIFSKSKLVVVPSLWPEPFGRVALEALSRGTPTVVSNRGGLPQIIKDGKWGIVSEPSESGIKKAIYQSIRKNKVLYHNIKKDYEEIKRKYKDQVVDSYLKLYNSLVKNK